MYKGQRFLAVIPARSGSKGIPNKNIIEVEGRPLIDFTISEAKQSKYLDEIILSTDSNKVAQVSEICGLPVPFLRSEKLATDDAKTIDVLLEVIEQLKKRGKEYEYVVLLQPTQPLRKTEHIDAAIESMIENQYDSLVSVSEVNEHPILMRTIDEKGLLQNLLNQNSTVRRQDLKSVLKVNGSIYINKIDKNFNEQTSLNDNHYPFLMDTQYDLDIDDPNDLKCFEFKLNNQIT